MKSKYLWIFLGLIGISWIFNYTYYQYNQLDKPIFLKHYYVNEIYDENQLTFYYLTNKDDRSLINYVRIDGVDFYPQNQFGMWSNNIPPYVQEFRHHYLRSVTIPFSKQIIPIKDGSNMAWSFEDMEIGFSNQPPSMVNIGKVQFSPITNQERFLESRMSSSNNQHRSDESLVALESVIIEGFDIPFPELNDDIEVKINLNQKKLKELEDLRNGKEIPKWLNENMQADWNSVKGISIKEIPFPFTLEKNEWLNIMTFTNPEANNVIGLGLRMKGKTIDGKTFTSKTYISEQPYLEQKDVDEIIAESKGGKE
ncbi:MAG TPA: hypothetical protein VEV44_00570 [Pseudoneobacillus sp.]|nr:hypothetical protein [Pseudoneobacillus sp.]